MNGTILLPRKFTEDVYITDRYHLLFKAIAHKLNWKIVIGDDIKASDVSGKIVMTFKSPQHDGPKRGMGVLQLPPDIKVIVYTVDVQCRSKGILFENHNKVFNRASLIICPYDDMFRFKWPHLVNKYAFFPQFFGPIDRYSSYNKPITERKPKCLLLGAQTDAYPIRISAARYPEIFDVLPYGSYLKKKYAEILSSYACVLACTSIHGYALAKHFEIPAAGALMISDTCADMRLVGLEPGVHFANVRQCNVIPRTAYIIENIQQFAPIAEAGKKAVRLNHSIDNRADEFVALLKKREII